MSSTEPETRIRILQATLRLMEAQQGQGVRMSDIAAAAGVSRQALYLHFTSRTELLVATTRYGDELHGLEERRRRWRMAKTGPDLLTAYIEFWGNYIPEIYGIARALMTVRDTDEAAAAAWNDRMAAVRGSCRYIIETLQQEGTLAPGWTGDSATDMLWTMVSIRNWEQLTLECGWSTGQYVTWMQTVARRVFVQVPEGN